MKIRITLSTRRTGNLLGGDDSNSILGSELNAKNSRTSCEQFRTSLEISLYKRQKNKTLSVLCQWKNEWIILEYIFPIHFFVDELYPHSYYPFLQEVFDKFHQYLKRLEHIKWLLNRIRNLTTAVSTGSIILL
jgi:hypothetical protein